MNPIMGMTISWSSIDRRLPRLPHAGCEHEPEIIDRSLVFHTVTMMVVMVFIISPCEGSPCNVTRALGGCIP